MDLMERFDRFACLAIVGFALAMCASAPNATAADDGSLSLTLVNGAGSGGEAIAEKLRKILRAEEKVTYVDEDDVLSKGSRHGVDVEVLRKGSERARHKPEFRKTMRAADIHAILVLDVFSGTAQIVTVGPNGNEISDQRKGLSGGTLETRDAGAILKAAFEDLIPKWRSWQKEQEKKAESSSSSSEGMGLTDTDSSSDSSTETSLTSGTSGGGGGTSGETSGGSSSSSDTGGSTSPGTLDDGVTIWLGGIAGRHELKAKEQSDNDPHKVGQVNPFIGARFELDAVLGRYADNKAGFGLEVWGSYAPFETVVDKEGAQLSSDITQLGVDVNYLRQLSSRLQFEFGTGFEVLSLRVSANPDYTGNRYAQFRFTGSLTYQLLSSLAIEAGGGLGPIVRSDMSGGAYGNSLFAPAVLGNGAIELTAFEPFALSLEYDLYYYDLVYRTPFITENPVDVNDTYHFGGLKMSYAF